MAGVLLTSRRPSTAWGRLKNPNIDPLDSMGLPSKGDNRLLDFKTQESYYNKIVERYMQFCAAAGRNDDSLERAFASMSLHQDLTGNRARQPKDSPTLPCATIDQLNVSPFPSSSSSKELSTLTLSMRKLREALVATHRHDLFSQRAYIFIIRACILTKHHESYNPALLHLLRRIHPSTPLPTPELHEFVGYYVLDLACRQEDVAAAFAARREWRWKDKRIESVLRALVHDNWCIFWRIRGVVDGYQRRLMEWAQERVKRQALKCLGRSYLSVEREFVEVTAGGRAWAVLKERDGVGWELDGSGQRVTIRRVRGN